MSANGRAGSRSGRLEPGFTSFGKRGAVPSATLQHRSTLASTLAHNVHLERSARVQKPAIIKQRAAPFLKPALDSIHVPATTKTNLGSDPPESIRVGLGWKENYEPAVDIQPARTFASAALRYVFVWTCGHYTFTLPLVNRYLIEINCFLVQDYRGHTTIQVGVVQRRVKQDI